MPLSQGVSLAYQLHHLISTFLVLHLELSTPLSKAHVQAVFRLAEMLKAIQQTYHRRSLFVAKATQESCQHLNTQCVELVSTAYRNASRSTRLSPKELDVQSALELLRRCSAGPSTRLRKLTCELALHIAAGSPVRDACRSHGFALIRCSFSSLACS